MATDAHDPFRARTELEGAAEPTIYYRLAALEDAGIGHISRLPFSIKVLLEALLRQVDGFAVTEEDVRRLANWDAANPAQVELPFKPARVVMQDFTGVPGVVDLAAMRSAMARLGGDPKRVNPLIPVDLVIDHSVQVDQFGSAFALLYNAEREFERNRERYEFLKWGQQSFDNFRVVPPATGIVHQVNLEYLASVVQVGRDEGRTTNDEDASSLVVGHSSGTRVAYPDTVVGTDSHTTMINGLGVLGWGVGGIEAEAVMLGQPIYMLTPQVVGFKLTGELPEGATATDLVLTGDADAAGQGRGGQVRRVLRPRRRQVEPARPRDHRQHGARLRRDDGLLPGGRRDAALPGAFRPLRGVGRSGRALLQGAGPLPHRRNARSDLHRHAGIGHAHRGAEPGRPQAAPGSRGTGGRRQEQLPKGVSRYDEGRIDERRRDSSSVVRPSSVLGHGSVVLAAITSCTNTSNPSVMVGAGLLAKKAAERGLQARPWVKTSLAPGSKVVTRYLDAAGLTPYLEAVGFYTVGYGCTTCIGNSGPLAEEAGAAVRERNLTVAAVISGNRNFEGRVHPQVRANYLASPPLVVAYALAGTVDIDLTAEPLGADRDGNPVLSPGHLAQPAEIQEAIASSLNAEMYRGEYANVFGGNPTWNAIPVAGGDLFPWDNAHSTYIHEPPFFVDLAPEPAAPQDIRGARVLAYLGDNITTDHISPAGSIEADSPAGRYLIGLGVPVSEFNQYGARPRQPRSLDARHLRQHPHQEQAGAGG